MNESKSANELTTTAVQEASERIFQATLRTVMHEQFRHLGKRQKSEPLQDSRRGSEPSSLHSQETWEPLQGLNDDTKDDPIIKRTKIEQRPKFFLDVEGKVVMVSVNKNADCNMWYALSIEDLTTELKSVTDQFPNPDCANMIQYIQTVCEFSVEKRERCKIMSKILRSWYNTKYYLRETPLDCGGNTRQLWKPLCVVSIDLHADMFDDFDDD